MTCVDADLRLLQQTYYYLTACPKAQLGQCGGQIIAYALSFERPPIKQRPWHSAVSSKAEHEV